MGTTEGTSFCHLASEALLQLEGIDAKKFLQGQTTADFDTAVTGDVLAGAFCDVKGRVLADFLAAIISDSLILLRLDQGICEQLINRLKPYLMFSKSTLTHTDTRIFGATTAEPVSLNITDQFSRQGDAVVLQRDNIHAEFWLLDSQGEMPLVTTALEYWQRASILRGEARISLDTVGKYLPQDLNYDLNGWVNFKKGCYTGQEIIARLHYRGKPKRRLVIAHYDGVSPMQPGTALYTAERAQAVGSVVKAAMIDQQQWLLIECIENGLSLGLGAKDDGTQLTPL